ncbi:MAG: IS1595 family transposase [Nitrospirales bacterium]|nr:IS1595 family transposase [Nitrospira sp.]MDR4460356.1 IS1595 family transposase [Nitrospirales bacterium]MDR4482350.1 IS1595 family transposase [Nitrospirales bacterium]
MTKKNRYANRARISTWQVRQLVRYFVLDLTASQMALLTGLNRNTINRYVRALRERIAEFCEAQSPFGGEVEVDESYFGARRIKGKRGRGAYGKTIVFGIFQRNGQVYTELVPDCRKPTLQAIIRGKVALDSVIYSDGWRGYNGLVDVGYGKHLRVDHGKDEFVRGRVHVNGIEGFWGFAKTRLLRFRGIHKGTFYLHLKECEFRFNHRGQNLYHLLLKVLRKHPLN